METAVPGVTKVVDMLEGPSIDISSTELREWARRGRSLRYLVETAVFDDAAFLQSGEHSTLILFQIDKLESRVSVIPAHGARGRGHVAFAIASDEMQAWRERLQAQHIEIEHEQDWPLGTHSIYFRDPDDNSIELIDRSHYPQVWAKNSKE